MLSQDDDGITRLRVQHRSYAREFTLHPGEAVTLRVQNGKIYFEGHSATIPAGVVVLPR
jgi:hypothetical protein